MTEYKFDIIDETEGVKKDEFPKYLLGDSIREAEETLATFDPYINGLSSSYYSATGIDKSDFFGEAVLALGRAKRDFNPKRSDNFHAYAKFLIVDAMNECVRNNRSIVKVPVYIYKTHKVINRIKTLAALYTMDTEEILFVKNYEELGIPEDIISRIEKDRVVIGKAASRARVTYTQLVERAEFIPLVIDQEDMNNTPSVEENHGALMAKLVVDQAKPLFDVEEALVAELLMEDLSKSDICKIVGHSSSWVMKRMKSIRTKITKEVLNKNS